MTQTDPSWSGSQVAGSDQRRRPTTSDDAVSGRDLRGGLGSMLVSLLLSSSLLSRLARTASCPSHLDCGARDWPHRGSSQSSIALASVESNVRSQFRWQQQQQVVLLITHVRPEPRRTLPSVSLRYPRCIPVNSSGCCWWCWCSANVGS